MKQTQACSKYITLETDTGFLGKHLKAKVCPWMKGPVCARQGKLLSTLGSKERNEGVEKFPWILKVTIRFSDLLHSSIHIFIHLSFYLLH